MRFASHLRNCYLILIALAMFMSAVFQLFGQYILSSEPVWNYAPGWQREIAIWNIAFIIIILFGLFNRHEHIKDAVILSVAVLTLCLGLNHLTSLLVDKAPGWHGFLAFFNLTGSLCSIFMYWLPKVKI